MTTGFLMILLEEQQSLHHELVHQLGFGHPEGTTDYDEALALATRNSRRARRSPENFEHLYELYFCNLFDETPEIPLEGFYLGSNQGYYYVRQIGNEVFWFGESPNGSWSNIMFGTISGNIIRGEYVIFLKVIP
ncbi:MAG: hypothetical protein R3B93_03490 [Bacteroidia bacterium]